MVATQAPTCPFLSSLVRYPVRVLVSLRQLPWRPVLLSFLAARLVILVALWVSAAIPASTRDGLLGWDAGWYLRIAQDGYDGLPAEGHRFFPLLPILGYAFGVPLGDNPGLAMLLLTNASAIAYALLATRLAMREGLDQSAADRVPWVVAFAPAGFVLVMGYTEALFGVLVCAALLAARGRRWWLAAVAGALAGLLRPTGVVLVLPMLLEALGPRAVEGSERTARCAAVLAPIAGLASYLCWSWFRFGAPLDPLIAQTEPGLRGGLLLNPLDPIGRVFETMLGGPADQLAPVAHLPWVCLSVALLIVGRNRLSLSSFAFSAVMVLLGLTARDYASFERYASSAVPLLIVAASLLTTPARRIISLAIAALALTGYSIAAFLHLYVP